MTNFVSLENVLGNSQATKTTVNLFNSNRPYKKDSKGSYIEVATKPYKNGVIIEKRYFN